MLRVAGRHVTQYLQKLLEQNGYSFNIQADMELLKDIKEQVRTWRPICRHPLPASYGNTDQCGRGSSRLTPHAQCCFVSCDPALDNHLADETTFLNKEYRLPDGQLIGDESRITLARERFQAAECLFNPGLIGVDEGEHRLPNTAAPQGKAGFLVLKQCLFPPKDRLPPAALPAPAAAAAAAAPTTASSSNKNHCPRAAPAPAPAPARCSPAHPSPSRPSARARDVRFAVQVHVSCTTAFLPLPNGLCQTVPVACFSAFRSRTKELFADRSIESQVDIRIDLFRHIVLSGGTTMCKCPTHSTTRKGGISRSTTVPFSSKRPPAA